MNASYALLLGLHLLAIVVFLIGLLIISFALLALGQPQTPDRLAGLQQLRTINRYAVTPALLLAWALGLALAIKGGWLAASWLHAKIAFVVLLSALHGFQTSRLRRAVTVQMPSRGYSRWWALAMGATSLVIIGLATGKPG